MKYSIIVLICAVCIIACAGRKSGKTQVSPTAYGYKIVNSYPHDTGAYTQGLFWHDGLLYESTGEYGKSSLRRVTLETGETVRRVDVPDEYFAEGAALLDGKIYQLTWHKGKCFVYDAATFERTGEFSYNGEGWGLATDGARLYMSDGSANITVRNPADFSIERTIVVRNAGRPVQYLNELSWIEGKIWANLYVVDYREMTSPKVVIIDPASGVVEGVVDFTGIYGRLEVTPDTDVMNGIAYDPATKRIFVTGKRWNRLFEIEIIKK